MLKCLIALTSLLSVAAIAAPAWTWVDAEGRRHYSDRPVEGATQIELAGPQTFAGGVPQPVAQPASSDETGPPPYTVLDVISPADGETLSNIGGTLTLEVAVYPRLQASHRVDAILNGARLNINSRGLSLTITDMVRGEHSIQAVILGSEGEELLRSEPITLFVRQTSLLTPPPQRVLNPPPPPPPSQN